MTEKSKNPLKGKIIAIDGPAGAGKGTLAKTLAKIYRMKYLDTGTLYRTVAYRTLENGGNPEREEDALKAADLSGYDFRHIGNNAFSAFWGEEDITDKLRHPTVGAASSKVAFFSSVRQKLKDFQVSFAMEWAEKVGVILDGRDIGTVICPTADIKLFLDASAEKRALRRLQELEEKGFNATYEEVLAGVLERDARDRGRKDAPLKAADDAFIIDSSDLTVDDVLKMCQNLISSKLDV